MEVAGGRWDEEKTTDEIDIAGSSDIAKDKLLWNRIWNAPVLPHIKVFFWQLCNDALATRKNLSKRVESIDEMCPRCCYEVETCLYVVQGCGWVKGVWKGLGLRMMGTARFERVKEWVEWVVTVVGESEWVEIMTGCWAVWERMNKALFDDGEWRVEKVAERVRELLWEMREVNTEGRDEIEVMDEIRWSRPRRGVKKINVDAGIKSGIGSSWGAVCRGEDGMME
ncbi:uncharacterized protein LOC141655341 [Silene latifolia]|uniref:uncharacterized protein LOC141655341 n=1 Tax=Silene latifolia TaxID=37657 RepID=UPI003D778A28